MSKYLNVFVRVCACLVNFFWFLNYTFFINYREIERNIETPESNRETPNNVFIAIVILLSIGLTIILASSVIRYLRKSQFIKGIINCLILRVIKSKQTYAFSTFKLKNCVCTLHHIICTLTLFLFVTPNFTKTTKEWMIFAIELSFPNFLPSKC